MNYIDKNVKEINNNNTMGILICKRENRFVIEYCSDGRIAVREYELVWYEKMTLKNKLIDDEVYSRVKDYSKEKHKVITFFEIEKLLNEAGSKYGVNIIDRYSEKLVIEVGKKYNRRILFRMKQFYNIFSDEKVSTVWTQLILKKSRRCRKS